MNFYDNSNNNRLLLVFPLYNKISIKCGIDRERERKKREYVKS